MPQLGEVLERAAGVLAELAEVDLDGASDVELEQAVLAFQGLRGRLEAAEAAVLGRWDARRCWQPSGARTGAAWLAWKQRIPVQVARQRLRHARAVRTLPAAESAWRAGEIDRAHLSTLLRARTSRTHAAFDTDHEALVDAARSSSYLSFRRQCQMWEVQVDPDGAEQGAEADRAAREVHLSESFAGMWFGRLTLDPVSGEIVDTTLRSIEQELYDAERAAAKERLGRDPLPVEMERTPAQRRADALVEMATRARNAPPGGRRPAPLFTVVVDLQTLMGPVLERFNRRPLTPGTAAAWLGRADVERVVFDGPSRVLEVGATRRFFRGALRRAIEVRDRCCFHPSCDDTPERPHIDHIHQAAHGGLTTQDNGRLGCSYHNLWRIQHPDPDEPP